MIPRDLNAAHWFVDRHIAEGRDGWLAILYEGRRLTYGDVYRGVNRLGNALRRLGVAMEQRVVLLLQDSPEFVWSFWGAIKIGAVPIPTSTLFTPADYEYILNDSRARVTIISEAFAHRFFPNEDPIGKQLVFSFPPTPGIPREIVGMVGDVRDAAVGQDPGPMMYVPFDQSPFWGAEAVVRSTLSPGSVAATIRHEVHEVDKDLPVGGVVSLSDLIDASVAQPRFRTLLLGSFAALALVLAAAGIFGVISYSVSRRTHEIGVRITLGASPASVMRLILTESARLVLMGFVVGIPVALGLGRFLSTLLFGIRAADPSTFTAVAVLLLAVGTLAAYVPARRAIRVDPLRALRHE